MLSQTEENYLKCIYKLSLEHDKGVSTNAISAEINTTAASVTDMLKKLSEKGLLDYVKYKGVRLTEEGDATAKNLIRKHRLWEVFLVEKFNMKWDEVHDIAEQLEHIQSPLLVQRLDEYLGFPKFDPHGDPIPDQYGNYAKRPEMLLSEMSPGQKGVIIGVRDHSSNFLQYLATHNLVLGSEVSFIEKTEYDQSVLIQIGKGDRMTVSQQVATNLVVSKS